MQRNNLYSVICISLYFGRKHEKLESEMGMSGASEKNTNWKHANLSFLVSKSLDIMGRRKQ